jgi:uncharacterized protein (TIGR00730 family)
LKRVAIYCGSNVGASHSYAEAAQQCGTILASRGLGLVYGGGNVGLMGLLADAALAGGGQVIGVIPRKLIQKNVAHHGISQLVAVDSMHERKQRMADLADAFVALPGGIGTMEELFEVFTWLQLGFHHKPVGLLNISGFYNPLLQFLAHMRHERFLRTEHLETLLVEADLDRLLDRMAQFVPPSVAKWTDRRAAE